MPAPQASAASTHTCCGKLSCIPRRIGCIRNLRAWHVQKTYLQETATAGGAGLWVSHGDHVQGDAIDGHHAGNGFPEDEDLGTGQPPAEAPDSALSLLTSTVQPSMDVASDRPAV